MTNKSVLIVNYYFPPFHRVGGRRWAKFAKYLFRSGWDVHVVAGDFPGSFSPWEKDLETYRDRIHRVTRTSLPLPYFKNVLPKNPVQKIRWKLSKWIFESFTKKNYKGDYIDPSYLDGPAFAVATQKVLKLNPQISIVVVSVGPYYYAKDVLKLKKAFPKVSFWLDYRDVWSIREGLTTKQYRELLDCQAELNQMTDVILSVNDTMSKDLSTRYKKPTFTIPHTIDNDDFEGLDDLKPNPKKLKFVYGGDLYIGFEAKIILLNDLLEYLHSCGFDVQAIVYADKRKHPHQKWSHVQFQEPLMLSDFFEAVKESDFSVILRGSSKEHQFSTKVFELIKLGRPILIVDDHTPELDFIEENKLGLGLTPESAIPQLADKIIEQKLNKGLPVAYNLQPHTIDHTCKALIDLFSKEF